jgi:hypothetical protein
MVGFLSLSLSLSYVLKATNPTQSSLFSPFKKLCLTCTSMFIAALFTIFTIAKLWKQPRCPTTDEWIKKMWYL